MSVIDHPWAIKKLQSFLETAAVRTKPGNYYPNLVNLVAEVQKSAQVAEQILDRVVPGWRTATWQEPTSTPFWREREAANRAIAQLQSQDELNQHLGTDAPQLDAATLHPWVWGSVQGLWSSGHYREAVGMAAKAVNAQAQAKVGRRDLSEWKLLSNAFSTQPPKPGEPRLRLMLDDGGETFKNRHEGAGNYARGVYAAIRNPIAHEIDEELNENEALEQLAAFSILARWVDAATVETAG